MSSEQRFLSPRRTVRDYGELQAGLKREFRQLYNAIARNRYDINTLKDEAVEVLNGNITVELDGYATEDWVGEQGYLTGDSSSFAAADHTHTHVRTGVVWVRHIDQGFYSTGGTTVIANNAGNLASPRALYLIPGSGRMRSEHINISGGGGAAFNPLGTTASQVNDALNSGHVDMVYIKIYYARIYASTTGQLTLSHLDESNRAYTVSQPYWINPPLVPIDYTLSPHEAGDRMIFNIPMSTNRYPTTYTGNVTMVPFVCDMTADNISYGTPSTFQPFFQSVGSSRGGIATASWYVWQIAMHWVGFGPAAPFVT